MNRLVVISILISIYTVSADVVSSKDSLKVYNNNLMSWTDGVFLVNQGTETVSLDSVKIIIDEIAQGELFSLEYLRVAWRYYNLQDSTSHFYIWNLHEDSSGGHKLISESGDIPESMRELVSGDSIAIQHFEIGDCFMCSSLPRHPAYIRGTLLLYYTSGIIVSISLYSDDWRTGSIKKRRGFVGKLHVSPRGKCTCLLNGRKMENAIPENRYRLPKAVIIAHP